MKKIFLGILTMTLLSSAFAADGVKTTKKSPSKQKIGCCKDKSCCKKGQIGQPCCN